jgi:hypothetical protein
VLTQPKFLWLLKEKPETASDRTLLGKHQAANITGKLAQALPQRVILQSFPLPLLMGQLSARLLMPLQEQALQFGLLLAQKPCA